jgi:4-hydroxybenzoate polyprenyltransferase
MLTKLRYILEMIRFSHTLFALPFALLAGVMAWVANARGTPPVAFRWQELAGIICCMVFARSAAMAFNRLADWRLDARNPRTERRHIPAGLLTWDPWQRSLSYALPDSLRARSGSCRIACRSC